MIEQELVDGIAIVRLARGKVNALDLELLRAITATFQELAAGPCRAIVLTGSGRAFSAGVDLWRIVDGGDEYVRAFLPALNECFETVFNTPKPVVAAVNGHAIAGGCILVACCDHRLMAEGTGRIGVTELLVGVPFPLTPLEILGYATGSALARAAVLTGETYSAAEAVERGLADATVPADAVPDHAGSDHGLLGQGLLDRALAVARRLAEVTAPDTYALTKQQLHLDVNERLARHRPAYDPPVTALWEARVADGTIRGYMERVTARR
jgi:enoyl-CoA hydratase